MKNFSRVLKLAWRYRGRLIFSLICALLAGLLWGLNFSAVYPVLQVLGNKQNLQEWVDSKIDAVEKEIETREKEMVFFKEEQRQIEQLPPGTEKDRREHQSTDNLDRVEDRLSSARARQWRYQLLKHHVIRFMPSGPFYQLAVILGCVILAMMLKGVFEYFQESTVGVVANRTILDLRNRFYRHAIHQDMRQIQEGGSAELMSRFTNDMEIVNNGLKILFGRVVAEPLRALACISIACWISWQLTLLFIVIVVPAVYIMTTASKMMKKATRRVLERMGSIYKVLQETFQGLRVVKAYTMEPYERRRFHSAAREYAERSMRVVRIDAATSPAVELTGVIAVSLALLAGAYLVLSGEKRILGFQFTTTTMETEMLLWLYAQLIGLADPVRKLSSVYTKLQSAAAAADRIYAVLDREPEVKSNPDAPRLERHSKYIEFQHVCFSYVPEKQVLTNICFRVQAGETIGIVGANGSGKSTLINLLPRFYDPDHGSIVMDGVDIRKANLRSLRRQLAIVSQDPFLFDDTILNNIRYGNRRATQEQVIDAAKRAGVDEFVQTLPQGYETKAGDAGTSLSGGQKQRIALARAILRNPAILLLDEFSSAIDPKSDAVIHEALREFKKGRTTFFVTHKMHTLEMADRIFVIDNHELIAVGTHAELMTGCPVYRGLYDAQIQLRAA